MRLKWNIKNPLLPKHLGVRAATFLAFSLLFPGCLSYEKASLSGSSTHTTAVPTTSDTRCSSNQAPNPKVVFLDSNQISIGGTGLKCVDYILLTGPGNNNTILASFRQINVNQSGTYLTASPLAAIGNVIQLAAGATYKLFINDANAASVISTIQLTSIAGPVVITSGNVGIGSTSPSKSLDVMAPSAGTVAVFKDATGNGRSLSLTTEQGGGGASLGISNNSQYWDFGVDSAGKAFISPSGSTAMTLTTTGNMSLTGGLTTGTGNVGIGTAAPLSKLHVVGASTGPAWISASDATANASVTGYFNTLYSGSSGDPNPAHIWSASSDLRFGTWGFVNGTGAWNERMRFTAGGNVAIGTTSTLSRLTVKGSSAGTISDFSDTTGNGRSLALRTEQGGGGASLAITNNGQYWDFGVSNTGNAFIAPAGGSAMTLTPAGVMHVSGSYTSSDRRLKKNVLPLNGSLEKVLKLQGVTFEWRKDIPKRKGADGIQIGMIAQNVEALYPELVSSSDDGYKSVSYSSLVVPVLEGLKEFYQMWKNRESDQDVQNAALKRDAAVKEKQIQALTKDNAAFKRENALIKAYLCGKDTHAPFCKSM